MIYHHSYKHNFGSYEMKAWKNKLTTWPAHSWLDNSVSRALQLYRRDHEFEFR